MKSTNFNLILLLSLTVLLPSCAETIFIGAISSAMEFAKDRTPTETVQDVKIATTIKSAFIQKGFFNLYMNIKPEVMRGRVLLTGEVAEQREIVEAINLIWQQDGITEVINELKVDKNNSKFNLKQYVKDSFITSQVKSKIFFKQDVKFINYTVITFKNVVYLFGIATTEQELEKVGLIAANISGVKQVVSHVKISEKTKNNAATNNNIIYKKTTNGIKKKFYEDDDKLIFEDVD